VCHNCVHGNHFADHTGIPDPTGSDGNIATDPRFAALPAVRLSAESPCVDAGDNNWADRREVDLHGVARIAGRAVDISAHEFGSALPFTLTLLPATTEWPYRLRLTGQPGQTYVVEESDCDSSCLDASNRISMRSIMNKPAVLLLWSLALCPILVHAVSVRNGLLLDLDASRGVALEDGDRVGAWTNQVASSPARVFVKQDEGRTVPGSGRPTLKRSVEEMGGHDVLVFQRQELINHHEDAFDHLTTGSGYTWFAVVRVYEQVSVLKDVNSIFGNLRNSPLYEGFWAGLTDDNRIWMGSRNGVTFGRWDDNNPLVLGPRLERDWVHVLAGRMGAGTGDVLLELFVNDSSPAVTSPFPVNPKANPSRMAVGQERDATNHPGAESFDGELARLLIYERPLSDTELDRTLRELTRRYSTTQAGR
jgi:hypothetical protein